MNHFQIHHNQTRPNRKIIFFSTMSNKRNHRATMYA